MNKNTFPESHNKEYMKLNILDKCKNINRAGLCLPDLVMCQQKPLASTSKLCQLEN